MQYGPVSGLLITNRCLSHLVLQQICPSGVQTLSVHLFPILLVSCQGFPFLLLPIPLVCSPSCFLEHVSSTLSLTNNRSKSSLGSCLLVCSLLVLLIYICCESAVLQLLCGQWLPLSVAASHPAFSPSFFHKQGFSLDLLFRASCSLQLYSLAVCFVQTSCRSRGLVMRFEQIHEGAALSSSIKSTPSC